MRTLIFSMMIASTFVLFGCTPSEEAADSADAPAAESAPEADAPAADAPAEGDGSEGK